MIECPICKQQMRFITNTHAKTHNLTQKEIKELYNIPINIMDTGYRHSKETLKKMGEKHKGFVPWNKGLTIEDKRVLLNSIHTTKTRKCRFETGEIHVWNDGLTKETSEKVAKAVKKSGESLKKRYELNEIEVWNKGLTKETDERVANVGRINAKLLTGSKQSEETKKKRADVIRGQKRTEETKRKMSTTRKKLISEGKIVISEKAGRGIKTKYNNITFRSTWEAKYAKWLDDHNVMWKYEQYRLIFEDISYLPDFFIYENEKLVKIVEIKGYIDKKNQKILESVKNQIACNFEVLTGAELLELGVI
jgi:hypothetical protein